MKRYDFSSRNRQGRLEKVGRLDMKAAEGDKAASLSFYGDIVSSIWAAWDDTDKCPQDIADFMGGLKPDEPLDIYFNSGGGDAWAGIAIHNILTRHAGHKHGIVDGLAASSASVILMGCDEITVNTGAQIMVHKPWSWRIGNSDDFRAAADELDVVEESIMDVYMNRAKDGIPRETVAELLRAETWMTGAEAQEYFKLDTASQPAAAACASLCFGQYRHTPENLSANQPEPDPPEKEPEETVEETTGDIDLDLELADTYTQILDTYKEDEN